ncbi:cytochrome P450 [Halocynthiibacter namhaensis]|uniref:cytochrome P450 n=1 Tax=Halocynthiibacter namhaensis TaxID=1290553 RepID=UPI00057903D5|nr:cytochrome P450 [Halocynthiibacter namhaensis]
MTLKRQELDKPIPARVPLVTEPWGLFRTLRTARRNVLEILPELTTRQAIVTGTTGKRWHMLCDPTGIQRVLKTHVDNYPKSLVTKNMLRPAIGDSMFIAEGAHWRWQRRAAAPVFSPRNVANLGPVMSHAADRAVARLEQKNGAAADMYEEMITATFEVISDVTFSADAGFDRDEMHRAIDGYISQAAKLSLMDILGFPDWVPRPGRLFSGNDLKRMKSAADTAVDTRRSRPSPDIPDLLDLLLSGEDSETKRSMNTAELRDNLLTFIVAGHETTALTLSWALYLCAFAPEVQERARLEAETVLQGRTATAEDCADLPYLRQIIDETLRLYPPAPLLSRTALKEDVICDREIRAKDTVAIPVYCLHRNHLIWENADSFDPDRFADASAIDRFAYLPFGAGPRICIGAGFAIQEAIIILATLLTKFRFHAVESRDPKPVMILTLRPEGGVWLKTEKL